MISEEFIRNSFKQEAGEFLENLESELLKLETDPESKDSLEKIFRIMHTLKGSAGMVGYEKISEFTHYIENIYDNIRKGNQNVTNEIITHTLKCGDMLKLLLSSDENLTTDELAEYKQLQDQTFIFWNINEFENKSHNEEITDKEISSPLSNSLIYIHYKPFPDIFTRGINPFNILEDLQKIGLYWSDPEFKGIPEMDDKVKDNFNVNWNIFLLAKKDKNDVEDLFFFYDEEEYKIFELDSKQINSNTEFAAYWKRLKNENPDSTFINSIYQQLLINLNANKSDNNDESFGFFTDEKDLNTKAQEDLDSRKDSVLKSRGLSPTESIRVSSHKLDKLINLVSELVITNSQLAYLAGDLTNLKLKKSIANVEKLSKQLRDNALELRLVPINTITVKFKRLIRDLSEKLNKDVELVTVGTDTELDSNIINKIEGPLMHIVRNSIDHGIEDKETRIKLGKNPKGIIRLISFYSGANVFIQVQDDGQGINTEYIRQKAIEKGIIGPADKLTDKELYDIIFLPGFSTAQNLTEISGRGVGMDVVKRNINELRGLIEIDSEIGLGTSVSIKLPLTLSIIDTLLIKVDKKSYLLPLNMIDSCHKIMHSDILKSGNFHIDYKDELLPFIYLRDFFNLGENSAEIEHLIVLEYNGKKYGIIADKVIGEHQAVVKPLGAMHKNQEYITGAGIMGDGGLALILDTNKMILKIKEEVINYD